MAPVKAARNVSKVVFRLESKGKVSQAIDAVKRGETKDVIKKR